MKNVRIALTFSLLLACGPSLVGDYSRLNERLRGLHDPEKVMRILETDPVVNADPELRADLQRGDLPAETRARNLKAAVDMRAMLEKPAGSSPPVAEIRSIKASLLYKDPGVEKSANWLSRALERLKNIRFDPPHPSLGMPLLGLGQFIYYFAWTAIAAVLGAVIYFAAKHVRWKRTLSRKASALLGDSEPERTLDEWLALADKLEAEGRYREAIRALYLASLLRFDEALVARFDRGETNWEHLRRIEASARLPAGLDFRAATMLFDRVWYGRQATSGDDLRRFRGHYLQLTEQLRSS